MKKAKPKSTKRAAKTPIRKSTKKRTAQTSQEKNKRISATTSFLPRKIVQAKIAKMDVAPYESLPATLFYGDISGFTTMSERLSKLGKEGSEEVTRIINHFFGPLIEIILKWGGDIYRFGGDAIFAFFTENGWSRGKEVRAVEAAKQVIDFVRTHKSVETKKGKFQRIELIPLSKSFFL